MLLHFCFIVFYLNIFILLNNDYSLCFKVIVIFMHLYWICAGYWSLPNFEYQNQEGKTGIVTSLVTMEKGFLLHWSSTAILKVSFIFENMIITQPFLRFSLLFHRPLRIEGDWGPPPSTGQAADGLGFWSIWCCGWCSSSPSSPQLPSTSCPFLPCPFHSDQMFLCSLSRAGLKH